MSWGKDQQVNNGRYQILDRIGTGGFGVTYRAIDLKAPSPDNIVAIKTVNEKRQRQANFEQHQENFLNEAVSLAKCRHPHVIRVDRVFQEAGLWAMVMEYVAGESLEDYILARGCLAEAEAIEIITKVGDAVSYVHTQELLHRDIKPANILIRSTGEPVLIDFGLARGFVVGVAGSMTSSQSPHYSPPEQGQRRGDFRSALDIYALAATLYSCVTGTLPPLAEIRVVRDGLRPPQEINDRLSERVNRAILTGMALKVGDRSGTVAEWLNLLIDPPSSHKKFIFETGTIEIVGEQVNIIKTQKQAEYLEFELGAGVKLEMVSIPAGSFLMGQSDAEKTELIERYGRDEYKRRYSSELPQHLVNVSAFYMGKYPITQNQYLAITGKNPSHWKGGNLPVEQVSYKDAQRFCVQLSNKIGQNFGLPSETPWEYACRAATNTSFYFGDTITTEVANFDGNYGDTFKGSYLGKATVVGSYQFANNFGLDDMNGNVWEWCEDTWHDNYLEMPVDGSSWHGDNDSWFRTLRGGSWYYFSDYCRSANRNRLSVDYHYYDIGFRIVRIQDLFSPSYPFTRRELMVPSISHEVSTIKEVPDKSPWWKRLRSHS